jgi:hypothetical protein
MLAEAENERLCRTDLKLVGNEKWLWSCVSASVLGNCQRCRERGSKFTPDARGLCACQAKIRPKTITPTARNSKFSFLTWLGIPAIS